MNTIFNELIDNFGVAHRALPAAAFGAGFRPAATLRADVVETDDAYLLSIDAPGIPRDRIDVSLENGILSVSADFDGGKDGESKAHARISERAVGRFSRRFRMPRRVAKDDIAAKLEDGVLSITIAKPSDDELKAETRIVVS